MRDLGDYEIIPGDYYRDPDRYACAFCYRVFGSLVSLQQHCEFFSAHAWCDRCEAAFANDEARRKHVENSRNHTPPGMAYGAISWSAIPDAINATNGSRMRIISGWWVWRWYPMAFLKGQADYERSNAIAHENPLAERQRVLRLRSCFPFGFRNVDPSRGRQLRQWCGQVVYK
jgi:hypothetical protein